MESGTIDWISVIVLIAVFIMSAIIHEVAHGYVAYRLGDNTAKDMGRLTLNPLKHLDPIGSVVVPLILYLTSGFIFGWMSPVPVNIKNFQNPRADFGIIGIAGPAINIAIAFILGISTRLGVAVGMISGPSFLLNVAIFAVIINIFLAVINMVPIPPLDGSRVLFALLPDSCYKIATFMEEYILASLLLAMFVVINLLSYLWHFTLVVCTFLTGVMF